MRENLKNARLNFPMTQAEIAQRLNISETYYQSIEYGQKRGSIDIWDALEDLFQTSQRKLRENTK